MFKNILGDKGLLTSWSAWGIFAFELGPDIVESAVSAGFVTAGGGDMLIGLVTKIGIVLGALGIRRVLGKAAK